MDLATHQRSLLKLVQGANPNFQNAQTGSSSSAGTLAQDAREASYLQTVATSPHLALVREIGLMWQIYVLERSCPLTLAALKARAKANGPGDWRETVHDFMRRPHATAYRETQAQDFHNAMSRHEDDLIRAVAQFERALHGAKQGQYGEQVILWHHDPYTVLHSLLNGTPLPEPTAEIYEVVVSADIPSLFGVQLLTTVA